MTILPVKFLALIWLVFCATMALAGGPEDYDYILQKYGKGDYVDYAALNTSQISARNFIGDIVI